MLFTCLNYMSSWGRLIGHDESEEQTDAVEMEQKEQPPWSALFLGGAKVVKSAYKKRRTGLGPNLKFFIFACL